MMTYEEAYEIWESLNDIRWTPEQIQDLQDSLELDVIKMYKDKSGKRTKSYTKAFNFLKDEFESEIKDLTNSYSVIVKERYDEFNENKEEIENRLKEYAKECGLPLARNEAYVIKTASSHTYSSQPSHNKYARESLNESIKLLELLGYVTNVVVNSHKSEGMYPSYWEDYELQANITPFDFYLLEKSGLFISVLNWAVLCWQKGTNHKVYFPFLSQDDYDKSLALMNKGFEITRENMDKEMSWEEINNYNAYSYL